MAALRNLRVPDLLIVEAYAPGLTQSSYLGSYVPMPGPLALAPLNLTVETHVKKPLILLVRGKVSQ